MPILIFIIYHLCK